MSRRRVNGFDPTTKKYQRLQRRMDVANLNGVVRVLKRFGTHDDLAAASLALWCIAEPARDKAREALRDALFAPPCGRISEPSREVTV